MPDERMQPAGQQDLRTYLDTEYLHLAHGDTLGSKQEESAALAVCLDG